MTSCRLPTEERERSTPCRPATRRRMARTRRARCVRPPAYARWPSGTGGTASLEAAEAIPLDPRRLDPFAASSRGSANSSVRVGSRASCGVARRHGERRRGRGLLGPRTELPQETWLRVTSTAAVDAARVFAAQKGATSAQSRGLKARLAAGRPGAISRACRGQARRAGSARRSRRSAQTPPGAPIVLDLVGFDPDGYDIVVTGEGTVDARPRGEGAGRGRRDAAREAGVRCVVFGGRVSRAVPGSKSWPCPVTRARRGRISSPSEFSYVSGKPSSVASLSKDGGPADGGRRVYTRWGSVPRAVLGRVSGPGSRSADNGIQDHRRDPDSDRAGRDPGQLERLGRRDSGEWIAGGGAAISSSRRC